MQAQDFREASDIYYSSSIISGYLQKYVSYLVMLGQSEKSASLNVRLIGKNTKLVTEKVDDKKSNDSQFEIHCQSDLMSMSHMYISFSLMYVCFVGIFLLVCRFCLS